MESLKTGTPYTPEDTTYSKSDVVQLSHQGNGDICEAKAQTCGQQMTEQQELKQLMNALKNFGENMDKKMDKLERGWHNGIS